MAQDDFKYMMQDLYRLYFGVKCTYREILANEDAYYKFKAVVRQYIIAQAGEDTPIETHLYYLTPDRPEAEVYSQLGARVKLNLPTVKKGLFGREQRVFREEIWKIDDLLALTAAEKEEQGIVLSELQVPKIKLREFAL